MLGDDWADAFKATGWTPGGAAPASGGSSGPGGGIGDDWASAFAAVGWSPGSSGASTPAGPAQALAPPPRAAAAGATGSGPYWGLATETARRHGLDPSLLAAVWDFESSNNPGAVNKSSGATGLGQVMPREAGFPDRPTRQELLDPATNAEWSARILKSGLDRYGSEDKALAAYLGAIDARGNITGAVDANGTGGNQYIQTVRQRQQKYGGQTPSLPTPQSGGQSSTSAAPAGGDDWSAVFRAAGWNPGGAGATSAPPSGGTFPATTTNGAPAGNVPATTARQATAAAWALSQLGSREFYNLCQRFIEQAYGTGGQYRSAAAAGQALFKTANPAEADVGDLVFFRPDASNGYAGHAAIYLGNGEMVGATNGGVTRDNLLTNPYWRNLLVGFGDPPDQWQGRMSSPELLKGAQQLVQSGQRAAASVASGVGGIDLGDWASAFRRAGWNG